ncbi:LPS assembly protein LptD [Ectothiorhodospiraceae bacterium 2226]|nr:LPS assembly protein LptD [Ectothiorhodospiraceae bacterium 2226]
MPGPMRRRPLAIAVGLLVAPLCSGAQTPDAEAVPRAAPPSLTEVGGRDYLWDPPLAPLGPEWALCPPQQLPLVAPLRPDPAPGVLYLEAARSEVHRDGVSVFEGNVVLQRDEHRIAADTVRYYAAEIAPDAGQIEAEQVTYNRGEVFLQGDHGRFDLVRNRGTLSPVTYQLRDRHGSGSGERVELLGEDRLRVRGARYTTCAPDDLSWVLRARDLRVNRATGQGSATHVVLNFKRVPILYTPYIRFPVTDERMSGFLYPSIGQSSRSGFQLALPYYWNIAPHRDATLTLNSMSRRGLMLQSEIRYLNPRSRGEVLVDYLPDDRLYGDDRAQYYFTHRGRPTQRWTVAADYHRVSDVDYLPDFGGGLAGATASHLERTARATYRADDWVFDARAQDFQTLRGTQPYQRVPQLMFRTTRAERPGQLNLGLNSELTYFDHPTNVPTGGRGDVTAAFSYPLRGLGAFLVPRVALRHTAYALEDTGEGENLSRTVPIASVDTGVFLERDVTLGGTPMLQTLEPRLYYLYVPYRDQDELPRFDTGRYDMSFAQLFRDDRYIGPDRVGDANQLTVALTSRLLESNSGMERLSASVGQIVYFADRRVQLAPGAAPETEARSDLLGAVNARLTRHWSAGAEGHWNPEAEEWRVATARAQYRGEDRRRLNLAYRLRRDQLEQTDVAAAWPIGRQWAAVGRWVYSLQDGQSLETLGGLGYEDCCWGLRVVGRRFLTADGEYDRAIMLELELKGLSSIGERGLMDSLLQDGILGVR